MTKPYCRNCQIPVFYGVMCVDCLRMIFVTVGSELVVGIVLFLARTVWR